MLNPQAADDAHTVRTVDRFVPHVSTVPANAGQTVGLFLRERVLASEAELATQRPNVVLCLHGGYLPGVLAYDLPFKDYSLMEMLARAGHDVFSLTHTGYGASPKPTMDDPCNVDPAQQHLLLPHVLEAPCGPRYPFKLVSSRTEWDEIETAVRFIKALRGVDKVSLFGWSTGVPRAGGFAALHPEAVDKIVLVAPAAFFPSDTPPHAMPEAGAPTILQTRETLFERRWQDDVRCEGQLEHPDIREVMWRELMREDGLGAHWGADGEGIMRAPNRMNFGWRANAAKIHAPTLVLQAEFDAYEKRQDTWKGLHGTDHKVFIKVQCSSHFMPFERARHVLHRVACEWLRTGTVEGSMKAEFYADPEGALHPLASEPAGEGRCRRPGADG